MSVTAKKLPPLITVDEFLARSGDGTGTIYELVDGMLRAQDAASDGHGTIQANLSRLIGNHLVAVRPHCRVVANPGIRPHLHAQWNHRIPELGVTCTAHRASVHATPDPVLLIEILSPSNAADTWSNIPLYATLPSVTEIVIVDSTKVSVEVLRRLADGSWPKDPATLATGAALRFVSIGLDVPIAEIYRGTDLG